MKLIPILLFIALVSTASRAKEASPVPKGQRVFTCGHSFHVFVSRMVAEMAANAGIKNHQNLGFTEIAGSRVIQHWEVPDDKNQAKAALGAGKVDVLTLSPIWMPDEGIEKFAALGLEHNPAFRMTVQEFWLPNDTYEPIYPLETARPVNHDATKIPELREKQTLYDNGVDEYVRDINKRLGKEVVLTVPVGQAAAALREKIVAGQALGLKRQWDLFRDDWGHPQVPLQVLSAYCHFAVIYKRSPVGLPMPSDFTEAKKPEWDARLNHLLQVLAWDAVIHHPMSGVTTDEKSRQSRVISRDQRRMSHPP